MVLRVLVHRSDVPGQRQIGADRWRSRKLLSVPPFFCERRKGPFLEGPSAFGTRITKVSGASQGQVYPSYGRPENYVYIN